MQKIHLYLMVAGVLPFVFGAAFLVFDISSGALPGNVDYILGVYGLIIASFMAGSHWGLHLQRNDTWSLYLPVLSNVTALALWVGFLVLPIALLLAALALVFLLLLILDKFLYRDGVISFEYFRARSLVTAIVVPSLVISGFYT